MTAPLYERVVTGYHGCDAAVAARVLAGAAPLNISTNAYDWLGQGIYFWEHGPQRAREWAIEQAKLSGAKIKEPPVLGARINLGECLDCWIPPIPEYWANGTISSGIPPDRNDPGCRKIVTLRAAGAATRCSVSLIAP